MVVLFLASVAEGLPPSLKRLRVLMVIDSQAENIGEAAKLDRENMIELFKHIFDNDQYPKLKGRIDVRTLGMENAVTQEDIYQYFIDYPPQRDEAFMFYYTGHGAYDVNEIGGHFLALSGAKKPEGSLDWDKPNAGDLLRWKLLDHILHLQPSPPLVLLVTDSCASMAKINAYTSEKTFETDAEREQVYEDLFFRHRGVMDFNSSFAGEPSWTTGLGSTMTIAFRDVLMGEPIKVDGDQGLDLNGDGFVSWFEVFQKVRIRTDETFQLVKKRAEEGAARGEPRSPIMKAKSQLPELYGVAVPNIEHINSVQIQHNVTQDGQRGMRLYSSWEVVEREGHDIAADFVFYDSALEPLTGIGDGNYEEPSTRQIGVRNVAKVETQTALRTVFPTFFPYHQLHVTKDANNLKSYWIKLRLADASKDNEAIAESQYFGFRY